MATVLLFLLVAGTGAPRWWLLALFAPAAIGAAAYLEAYTHFCAYFGWLGIFNFGATGRASAAAVVSPQARRADRLKATRVALGSAFIGLLVVAAAYALT